MKMNDLEVIEPYGFKYNAKAKIGIIGVTLLLIFSSLIVYYDIKNLIFRICYSIAILYFFYITVAGMFESDKFLLKIVRWFLLMGMSLILLYLAIEIGTKTL